MDAPPVRPGPILPPLMPWFPVGSQRLILREFRPEDQDAIQAYGADPEVIRYMDWGPNTPEMTAQFLAGRLAEQQTWPRLNFSLAVELAAEGRMIGAVRLDVLDAANRSGEIGYSFHRDYWGRGLAKEAAQVLAQIGFEHLGLHRLWASCDARNIASQRVLESLGMRREGRLARNVWAREGWRDTLVYAVLAEDWAQRASPAPAGGGDGRDRREGPEGGLDFEDGADRGRILAFGRDTGGRYGLMLWTVAPVGGDCGYGAHVHHGLEETFFVRSGELDFLLGETVTVLKAGDFVRAPPGVRHGYANRSGAPVELLVGFHPGGFEELFLKYRTDRSDEPPTEGFVAEAGRRFASEFEVE